MQEATQQSVRTRGEDDALREANWNERAKYFRECDLAYLRFLVPENASIMLVGCGTGDLLAGLAPRRGVGIDTRHAMIAEATLRHPELEFIAVDDGPSGLAIPVKETFDIVILSDVVGSLDDCDQTLFDLRPLCRSDTRIIVTYYNRLWEPILKILERLGQKRPVPPQSWLSTADIMGLLDLTGYETVRREWRQIIPAQLFGIGHFINRYVATLPGIRHLCLRNYVVARPRPEGTDRARSARVSIVIPCRNEKGNIEPVIQRIPPAFSGSEIIFVEGNSSDGTYEECLRVKTAYPQHDIKVLKQSGRGKGEAVRQAFAAAEGDILLILDADLTMPPEAIPKFHRALVTGKGEFVNGTRLIYPMEKNAMRKLNWIANRLFSIVFSYLLNQRFTDTLCGTKALWRKDYDRIAANRHYFGDFDPYGDFDLILGASKLNLKIVEIRVPLCGT